MRAGNLVRRDGCMWCARVVRLGCVPITNRPEFSVTSNLSSLVLTPAFQNESAEGLCLPSSLGDGGP